MLSGNASEGAHLFVLCHGFNGTALDMSVLKTLLTLAHPKAEFLSSEINEEGTEGNILEMGLKLA